mgnify:CR=1 FL=1
MDERIHIYIYEIVPLVCGVCLCGPHCGAELDHTPQNRQNRPDVTNTKNVYYSRLCDPFVSSYDNTARSMQHAAVNSYGYGS